MSIDHKSLLADLLTPVSAFLRLSRDAERAFLLESVERGERVGRYSFIGVDPESSFEGSFEDFRRGFPAPRNAPEGLPPFTGGAVGIFGYDMVRELERLPVAATCGVFDTRPVLMDFYSTVVAFDHVRQRIVIVSEQGPGRVRELEERLLTPAVREHQSALVSFESAPNHRPAVLKSNFTPEAYCGAVKSAQEYIRAGDIFQVVLSQQFEAPFQGDPFNVYRALRFVNPSPYLFFLKRGDLCVAGSSPEMLVRVQDRSLECRPIAGTRRRGRSSAEEIELEKELLRDEKERSEHLMLVDLGRNDLGRVCEFGSVQVERFMFVEKYSHVMHLVSSLKGQLRSGLDRFDALAACFPAGTVTGAPKVRAMEIIGELEPDSRGLYAGAIGYLDFSGNLDTCIAIRTIVFREGKAILRAGAGIVADSRPELELKECHNKAKALFRALELAVQLEGA